MESERGTLMDGTTMIDDPLIIAGREFRSRLIVGTGKYRTMEQMRDAIDASGAEMGASRQIEQALAQRSLGKGSEFVEQGQD